MTPKPNIILIFADQLRADALGCYGNSVCKTANLDTLANKGMRFEQAMVTQPTCTPSRASVLTGCYPSALRCRMVGCETPDDPRFLPRILAAQGYHTASIGKIHLNPQGSEPGMIATATDRNGIADYYGFQEIELVNGHGARCFGPNYSAQLAALHPDHRQRYEKREYYDHGLPGDKAGTYHWPYAEEIHSTHYIADHAVTFLEREHTEPFFLHVSFPDPHHPFTVPEPWASMYDPAAMPAPIPRAEPDTMPPWYERAYNGEGSQRVEADYLVDRIAGTVPLEYRRLDPADWQQVKALYYGMVSYMDHHIGRVLDALKASGQEDNTLVVFVSDHGDYLGDHGFVGKGYPFDSALRVPLLYSGPDIAAGKTCLQPASTLDIAPTLLERAGINEPVGIQGQSLSAFLRGTASYGRTTALVENDDDFAGEKIRTLVTQDWKLSYYTGRDYGELYCRQRDPEERCNLWDDPQVTETKNRLIHHLLEEVVCGLDILPVRDKQAPIPEPRKWIPRPWEE